MSDFSLMFTWQEEMAFGVTENVTACPKILVWGIMSKIEVQTCIG